MSFTKNTVCVNCGDFADQSTYGRDHVLRRIEGEFSVFLKKQLVQSAIFPENVRDRISLNATLIDLKQVSSIGAAAEYKSPVTSGATLTTKVSIRYELIDQEKVVGAWDVTSSSRSNSLAASTRLAESIDATLERNVRSLLLKIISDYSPNDSARAKQALTAIDGEVDNTRSILGYLVYGTTKTVSTTAGIVGEGLSLAAQNSGAIAAGLNSAAAEMDKSNRAFNDAHTQALLATRHNGVGVPASSIQTGESDGERSGTEASSNRPSKQIDANTQSAPELPKHQPRVVSLAQADPAGAAKRNAADQTAERRRADDIALAKERTERATVEQEQNRQKLASEQKARAEKIDEERQRLAAAKAEKADEQRAKNDYLAAMIGGVRLVATKCPDGAGHYYATGVMPKVKPKGDYCIDVHYEASCPDNRNVVSGVAKNFIGMSGCFGDTYQIDPKPACAVKDVRIRVTDVRPGC